MALRTFLRFVLPGATASMVLLSAGVARADTLRAELTRIGIDPQLEHLRDIDGGEVVIDLSAREIALVLRSTARPQEPVEIRIPLTATRRSSCNTTYTARRDGRVYDGPLEVLTVIDYQNVQPSPRPPTRPCPRPRAPVFISYEMVTSGFGSPVMETYSDFSANGLVRGPEVPPPRD